MRKIFFDTLYYGLFFISIRMRELQHYVKWVTLYIASVHASYSTMSRDVSAEVNRLIQQAFYLRQTCERIYNIIILLYIVILLLSTISSRWWVTSAHGDRWSVVFITSYARASSLGYTVRPPKKETHSLYITINNNTQAIIF